MQQPLDLEVGAGTMHPDTFLRVLGPEPWNVAYVQPSRRPADGRFGENPNRLFKHHQFQVILKPRPTTCRSSTWRPRGLRHRPARSTTCASRRTTGSRRRSAPGASAGRCWSTAWRSPSSPTSSRPAASTCADRGRAHLRARAHRDVPAGRRQRLRPRVGAGREVPRGAAPATRWSSRSTRSGSSDIGRRGVRRVFTATCSRSTKRSAQRLLGSGLVLPASTTPEVLARVQHARRARQHRRDRARRVILSMRQLPWP